MALVTVSVTVPVNSLTATLCTALATFATKTVKSPLSGVPVNGSVVGRIIILVPASACAGGFEVEFENVGAVPSIFKSFNAANDLVASLVAGSVSVALLPAASRMVPSLSAKEEVAA